MTDRSRNRELLELLDGFCNDTLTEEQARRLDAMLVDDPVARDAYQVRMLIEAELHAQHAGRGIESGLGQPAEGRRVDVAAEALRGRKTHPGVRTLFALAASLAVVGGLSSWVTRSVTIQGLAHGSAAEAGEGSRTPAPGALAARITATRNCRWRDPKVGVGYGAELSVGQRIELLAGVAEITFASGAELLLEGPATLDISSVEAVELIEGQLAATVPTAEASLSVRAASLGVHRVAGGSAAFGPAEFGLIAQPTGVGEVHVFRGDVDVSLVDGRDRAVRKAVLTSNEAAKSVPASTTVAKFDANNSRFVRSLDSSGPQNGLLAYEGFDYPAGPLDQQNGGFGWAGPWVDIESASSIDSPATNRVSGGSLVCQGLPSIGNRSVQSAQHNRIRRTLSSSRGGVFDTAGLVENRDGHRLIGKDGTTVYLSFVQRVDRIDDVFYGFELHRGDGNANRVLCVGNGADGAGYGVTSTLNAYGAKNYPKLGNEDTNPNLLVIKIEFGPADRDLVTVYRNPKSLLNENECLAAAQLRGAFAFDRISLGNFEGRKHHEVDEVRVGTAFRAVTGRRDPLPSRLGGRLAIDLAPRRPNSSPESSAGALLALATPIETFFATR